MNKHFCFQGKSRVPDREESGAAGGGANQVTFPLKANRNHCWPREHLCKLEKDPSQKTLSSLGKLSNKVDFMRTGHFIGIRQKIVQDFGVFVIRSVPSQVVPLCPEQLHTLCRSLLWARPQRWAGCLAGPVLHFP